MTTTTTETRIFIASPINATAGEWRDLHAGMTAQEIQDVINEVREEYGHEEYLLADYEGIPSSLVGDYGGADVEKIAAFLAVLDKTGPDVAREFVELFGGSYDAEEWPEQYREHFRGVYTSREHYARQYVEMCYDTGNLPAHLVDYDAVLRNLEASGEITFTRLDSDRIAAFINH